MVASCLIQLKATSWYYQGESNAPSCSWAPVNSLIHTQHAGQCSQRAILAKWADNREGYKSHLTDISLPCLHIPQTAF